MTFGEKLQLLRKQKGISQEQLAAQIEVSRQAVSKWELNNSLPDTENIIQLSEFFGVSTDYLLKESIENTAVNISQEENRKNKHIIWLGIGAVSFSAVSFFIIWILEKIYPAPIVIYNADTKLWKVGLENFIWTYGLENFVLLISLVFAAGIGLIWHRQIKKIYKIIKEKIVCSRTDKKL